MKKLNLLQTLTLLLMLTVLFQQSGAAGSQRVCGKVLSETLDDICVNGYKTKVKKSLEWDDYADNEVEDALPFLYANSPFFAKILGEQGSLMAKQRRPRHGIYDECCRKGCNYNELLSYCL